MRKFQQELILEMLDLCQKEHNDIRYRIQNRENNEYNGVEICKSYVLQIIEFIENIWDEESETVRLLKTYCTELEKFKANRQIEVGVLDDLLVNIEELVNRELKPDRIEIAFFPYNASMADALESVYLAAVEDPMCDAYWIPIPCFERKKDGTIGDMHYDGNLYSADMDAVDYKSYELEMRHPDIVFTHNPYDKYNYVTSIHPDYYSDVLKNACDLLVYIDYGLPYWVPRNPADSTRAEDIVMYPVQINSDIYIAYSQEVAECCKLALRISGATAGLYTEEIIQNKVVSLGSPKFDIVLNKNKSDYELKPLWEEISKNKKILLYNTSIGEILESGEEFLEEIRQVIATVQNQSGIVLWWRPHPLTESTLSSMRPQLLEEYYKIREEFINSKCGIYDDTFELNRAISYSDACLTCESSLMFLYLATGKPFTIITAKKKLKNPIIQKGETFHEPLRSRIENMQAAKGANIGDWNCCIWWDNFLYENVMNNVHYENFLERYLHFILNKDDYPEAALYSALQKQIFRDFVDNSDGTAGKKIYEYCKERVIENKK